MEENLNANRSECLKKIHEVLSSNHGDMVKIEAIERLLNKLSMKNDNLVREEVDKLLV